jgi:hypothetical protein
MSHSVLYSTFPVNILNFLTFCPVHRLLPFIVIYHSTFCPFNVFSFQCFSRRTLVLFVGLSSHVFYRRRFLLRHLVGESQKENAMYVIKTNKICIILYRKQLLFFLMLPCTCAALILALNCIKISVNPKQN